MRRLLLLALLLLAGFTKALGAEPEPQRVCPCSDPRYVALNERGRSAAAYRQAQNDYRAAKLRRAAYEIGATFRIPGDVGDYREAFRDFETYRGIRDRARAAALRAGAIVRRQGEGDDEPRYYYALVEGRDYRIDPSRPVSRR